MKKLVLTILSMAILFTFSGCASSKYKESLQLMENGEYEAAKEILMEIIDYEDSKELIDECEEQIILELLQGTWEYSTVLDIDGDNIQTYTKWTINDKKITWCSYIAGLELGNEKGKFEIKDNNIIIDWDSDDSPAMNEVPFLIKDGKLLFNITEDGISNYSHK